MSEFEMDSTGNISRRYRHLFRLPSLKLSIIYASIPVLVIELIARALMRSGLAQVAIYALVTEILLLLSIEIDYMYLRGKTKLAIFRRLASLSIVSNSFWLLITIVAAILFVATRSEEQFIALMILGMFLAIAFRGLVFGAVFFDRPVEAVPFSTVQPIILILPIVLISSTLRLNATNLIPAVAGGLIIVIAVQFYISAVNKKADLENFRPLELFQSFLKAWIIEDATPLEHFLEIVSKERVVNTTMVKIEPNDGGSNSALLIVPGIHPGPFYPVGSSNLPSNIYQGLLNDSIVPLTVHSISDHDLNLSTKSEVDRYVDSLKLNNILDHGQTMSEPVVRTKNKATASGLAFGSTALIALTLAPHGMEDFPVKVRDEIEKISQECGFKCELIIDTHNSEGLRPNDSECNDTVEAARIVIQELKNARQYNFRSGLAHTSETNKSYCDIGPAGVGLVHFEVNDNRFCFVVADANNSKIGFREEVFKKFEKITGSKILELCTSDTHVTAAKTSGAKGYVALGDLISSDDFVAILTSLYEKSQSSTHESSYSTSKVTSRVKTIGGEILNEFSGLLDKTSRVAKNGAVALMLVTILTTIAVALF